MRLGDEARWLGARLGVTAVLHTWSRDLSLHPHLHCIVTAGGLSPDRSRWVASGKAFLFPSKVMARLFRGLFLDGLKKLVESGALDLPPSLQGPGVFKALLNRLYGIDFRNHVKAPFGGAEHLYAYLGRYTHRIAISRARLISFVDGAVTFKTREGRTATLSALEFVRRFLMHVLPKGFIKTRHYGLFASPNVNTLLEIARGLLSASEGGNEIPEPAEGVDGSPLDPVEESEAGDDAPPWLLELLALTGEDLRVCPRCKTRAMVAMPLPQATGPPNGPPAAALRPI